MNTNKLLACCVAVFGLFASGAFAETISIYPKSPDLQVIDRQGAATARSTIVAEVTQKTAADWCGNWYPDKVGADLKQCIDGEVDNRLVTISADCVGGTLIDDGGRTFHYDGVWRTSDDSRANGRDRFRADKTNKIVLPDNADGGLVLAWFWRTLCPSGPPSAWSGENSLTEAMAIMKGASTDANHPLNDGTHSEPFVHNDSMVEFNYKYGLIFYRDPKPSIASTIKPFDLLFHGRIENMGEAIGTAYTFRAGCPPAPYSVFGNYDLHTSKFVLHGAAPVREQSGCRIIGYSEKAANATLTFDAFLD